MNGDPQIGTVYFLRQSESLYQETPDELREVGAKQLEVADLIREIGAKTIFVDGLYKDLALDTPEHKEEFCEYVKWILPHYLRERVEGEDVISYIRKLQNENLDLGAPSEKFLEFIGATSGALFVLALDEGIHLKTTVPPVVDEILSRWQRQEIHASEADAKIRLELRDHIVAREIREHLKKSPGDEVTLLVGSSHTLGAGFLTAFANRPPRVLPREDAKNLIIATR